MKKNRKRSKKMSVEASRVMRLGAVVMMLAVMTLVNVLASSSNRQIEKSIGVKEKQLVELEKNRERVSGQWETRKASDNIDTVLLRVGLAMKYAKPVQIVRMNKNGRPHPGQPSLAYDARRRRGSAPMASSGKRRR